MDQIEEIHVNARKLMAALSDVIDLVTYLDNTEALIKATNAYDLACQIESMSIEGKQNE